MNPALRKLRGLLGAIDQAGLIASIREGSTSTFASAAAEIIVHERSAFAFTTRESHPLRRPFAEMTPFV